MLHYLKLLARHNIDTEHRPRGLLREHFKLKQQVYRCEVRDTSSSLSAAPKWQLPSNDAEKERQGYLEFVLTLHSIMRTSYRLVKASRQSSGLFPPLSLFLLYLTYTFVRSPMNWTSRGTTVYSL